MERKETTRFDRTTAYLIDRKGKVREVFPMIIHARSSWEVILKEVREPADEQKTAKNG